MAANEQARTFDTRTEKLLTLKQAAALVPSNSDAGTVSPETVRHWITHGRKGIYLQRVKIGGKVFTSRESLERFTAKLSGGDPDREAGVDPTSAAAAKASLIAEGYVEETVGNLNK